MARRFRAEVLSCASELRVDINDVDQLVVDEFLDAETKEFGPVAGIPDAAEGKVRLHHGRVVHEYHACGDLLGHFSTVLGVRRER